MDGSLEMNRELQTVRCTTSCCIGALSAIHRQSIGNDLARATMITHRFTEDHLDPEPLTHA